MNPYIEKTLLRNQIVLLECLSVISSIVLQNFVVDDTGLHDHQIKPAIENAIKETQQLVGKK